MYTLDSIGEKSGNFASLIAFHSPNWIEFNENKRLFENKVFFIN